MTTNADRITLPWNDGPTDFTGGPNGITDVDPMSIFGYEFDSIRSYFWLSLGVFTLVVVALQLVNDSRTGRAWRALREDPLAAEVMSMPVNRLKLLAFMFGAATAGLTGTIFAAVQLDVFPQNFELPLLITRLRDGDPRRRRQHPGRRHRRDRDQRLARAPARPGERARSSSTSRSGSGCSL